MKKISLFMLLFFSSIVVKAEGLWEVSPPKSLIMNGIEEKIECPEKNKCIGTYTIPGGYEANEINIVPSLFSSPNDSFMPGDTYEFIININNNSKHNYGYVSKSFYIKPYNFSDKVLNTSSFIKDNVNSNGIMYRLNSSKPLMELYDKHKRLTDDELSDDNLGNQLIKKGYRHGVADLDKYILDYLGLTGSLEENAHEVASALWPNISEYPTVKESNKRLIEFGYNYFYNKLLSFHVRKDSLDDDKYMIGSWLRNDTTYQEMEKVLNNIKLNSNGVLSLNSTYFHINGPLRNPYALFEFGLDFGFKLNRLDQEVINESIDDITTTDLVVNDIEPDNKMVDTGINTPIKIILIINLLILTTLIIIKIRLNKHV